MRLLQYFLHEKRALCWLMDAIGIDEGRFLKSFILHQLGSLPVQDLCQILKQLVRHTCGVVLKI
jgi:hypothetical protein